MKEFLRPLKDKDYDGINFLRNENGDLEVSGFSYKIPSENIGKNEMGGYYDIIIFSDDPPKMPERFQAILTSPLHYISRMIDDGFLGIVAKVTETSEKFMSETFNTISEYSEVNIKYYEESKNDEQA
jgi:hypothetical protein